MCQPLALSCFVVSGILEKKKNPFLPPTGRTIDPDREQSGSRAIQVSYVRAFFR